MIYEVALVVYYNKLNRYSFNALIGAIDNDSDFSNLNIYFYTNEKELIENIFVLSNEYKKIILALSFATPQLWDIERLISIIKKENKNIFIIAGGPHPTGDPLNVLLMGVDLVVIGEGEIVLKKILKKMNENSSYYDLDGIAFLANNNFFLNRPKTFIDLNQVTPFSIKYNKIGPLELSRGCKHLCYYCQTPRIFSNKIRYRNISTIIEYLKILKQTNYTDLRFITTDAFSYSCNEIKNNPIEKLLLECKNNLPCNGRIFFGTFPSEVRPENVTEEKIKLILKYCSNKNIIIGAQSGSDKILKLCKRAHNTIDIINAVKIVTDNGLKANVDFIFGLPYEEDEDIKLTLELIEQLIKLGAKIHAHTFMPLPGTPYWDKNIKPPDEKKIKQIKKMIKTNYLYGNWEKQFELSKKIYEYISKTQKK